MLSLFWLLIVKPVGNIDVGFVVAAEFSVLLSLLLANNGGSVGLGVWLNNVNNFGAFYYFDYSPTVYGLAVGTPPNKGVENTGFFYSTDLDYTLFSFLVYPNIGFAVAKLD